MKKPRTTTRRNRTVRCAIYTRKSSEEGLEQGLNSLQAQREACEAVITSQRHEGWVCLRAAYDDVGFSGAPFDRPVLRTPPTLLGPVWHSRRPHQRHCGTGIGRDRDIAASWRDL